MVMGITCCRSRSCTWGRTRSKRFVTWIMWSRLRSMKCITWCKSRSSGLWLGSYDASHASWRGAWVDRVTGSSLHIWTGHTNEHEQTRTSNTARRAECNAIVKYNTQQVKHKGIFGGPSTWQIENQMLYAEGGGGRVSYPPFYGASKPGEEKECHTHLSVGQVTLHTQWLAAKIWVSTTKGKTWTYNPQRIATYNMVPGTVVRLRNRIFVLVDASKGPHRSLP